MLQFEHIWVFVLLPLPFLVFWLSPEFKDSSEAIRVPFFERLVKLTGQKPAPSAVVLGKNWLQRTSATLCWILIVIAMAGPTWSGAPIVKEKAARDMLLLVDLSQSMQEEDFTGKDGPKISRLDAVKEVLGEFIARRKSDRLGLAVFGSAAFPQAPFTEDHDLVTSLLGELEPGMAGPKTVIGDGIGLAIRLFEPSKSKNKVVLMLTDGNDSGSSMPVAQAAQIAKENGITIHTIAVGDPETVGEKALDVTVLQDISKTTGGRFFVALNRSELETIYGELDALEPEKLDTVSYRPKRALFFYPLIAIVLLNLLLALLMIFSARREARSNA